VLDPAAMAGFIAKQKEAAAALKLVRTHGRSELAKFILVIFKYATKGNRVELRAPFDGDSNDRHLAEHKSHILTGKLDDLVKAAYQVAELAAGNREKTNFAPPVATFIPAGWRATEEHLAEGLALNVECDAHPQRARAILEGLFGPLTVIVESGGIWTDPETGKAEPRLHPYLRLKVPARSKEELDKLKDARWLMTLLVGGDTTNISIVHPIRWPGSVHRKGAPKLCRIVELNPQHRDRPRRGLRNPAEGGRSRRPP
jgi:hypothetical protein